MMRDLIERFSYRFRLWARERNEEHLGAGETRPLAQIYRKDESIPEMVFRHLIALVGGVLVFMGAGPIVDRFAPKAAFVVFVILVILIPFWILAAVTALIGEWRAKKRHRAAIRDLTNR